MHRVQGVDEDGGAGDRQAGVERAPAKAVEQRGLALARETGFSQPRAKLGQTCGIMGYPPLLETPKRGILTVNALGIRPPPFPPPQAGEG
jgi:hypothetical protein